MDVVLILVFILGVFGAIAAAIMSSKAKAGLAFALGFFPVR